MKKSRLLLPLITIVVTLSYYLVVDHFVPGDAYANLNVGSQWQDNVSHALAFIRRESSPKFVVVGSSLTARLPVGMESRGEMYNLAFGGDGPLTGLKIIRSSKWRPKLIGIEVNLIGLPENSRLLERISGFRAKVFDEYFPFTMEWYSPPRAFLYWKKYQTYQNRNVLDDRPSPEVFKKLLDQQIVDHQKAQLNAVESLKRVIQIVEMLRQDGSEVFFYLCPIDSDLLDTPRAVANRGLFNQLSQTFLTLPFPEDFRYETTDGIHLTEVSAKRYAAYLIEKMRRLK